jgi:CRP-like cAMP-binding protein
MSTILAAPDPAAPTGADPLAALLARHPFLEGLRAQDVGSLAAVAMAVEFAPGDVILREGDPANRFYLIRTGAVALEAEVPDRGRVLIQTLGPGDVLGWSWLFPPYHWHWDARALERTTAVFFYGTRLREECESNPQLGYELTKRMTHALIHRLQAAVRELLNRYEKRPDPPGRRPNGGPP